jgi:hypothetical protein
MTPKLLIMAAAIATAAGAQDAPSLERLLERVARQEKSFVQALQTRTPLLETYIQEALPQAGAEAQRDHYFLGRLDLASGLAYTPIITRTTMQKGFRLRSSRVTFDPLGFAQMMFVDTADFNADRYRFEYVRREFLGEVRCLVFDVAPARRGAAPGMFIGRIWVEDRDFHIVRFNGTYTRGKSSELYFHFDSWRVSVDAGRWIPAFSYVEESPATGSSGGLTFKAQVRIWGYNSGRASRMDELTSLLVEMGEPVREAAESASDVSPLENQRSWERQAEENVLERLEKSGIIAAKGDVDAVLNTVVNNLIATNNLSVETRCRVLLTTPLETFTIGRTIVISRGLLDVLPDEASLAMVLSDELAHVALGHRTNTQFAFHDQTMFSDAQLLEKFRFSRSAEEVEAAGSKAVEILRNSPYRDKLSNAGLFLKALAGKAPQFPNLISASLGNRLADGQSLLRMKALALDAPALEEQKLEQIAALPLGSRVKLDPWTDRIALIKTKPVSLLSAREKLSFEIAPMFQHLTRAAAGSASE